MMSLPPLYQKFILFGGKIDQGFFSNSKCALLFINRRDNFLSSATNLPIKSWFLIYIALSRFHPLLVKTVELYVTVEIIVCFRNLSGLYIYTISFSYAIAITHQSPARSLTFLDLRQERKISLFYEAGECKGKDDVIPIARKYTINCSFSLISTTSICSCRDRFQFGLGTNFCKNISTSLSVTPHRAWFLSFQM